MHMGNIWVHQLIGVLRCEGSACIAREPKLQVVLTSLGSLWILNRGNEAVDLGPGELFGFNTGAYVEIQAGLKNDKHIAISPRVCLR